MITSAKGYNGQIEVYENKVVIRRKGFMAFASHGMKGDKEIYINQISSVQLKKASYLAVGYIQFAFSGGKEAKGGLRQATKDENTVTFNPPSNKAFAEIKTVIDELVAKAHAPASSSSQLSDADEIRKYAKLKEEGIITEEEFQAKKKDLLGL